MTSKEHLEKFKSIYKKRFGKDLSDQEALGKGAKLLRLVEIVYKPMTNKEFEQLQQDRRSTGDLPHIRQSTADLYSVRNSI